MDEIEKPEDGCEGDVGAVLDAAYERILEVGSDNRLPLTGPVSVMCGDAPPVA